jgi:hypothetical protein
MEDAWIGISVKFLAFPQLPPTNGVSSNVQTDDNEEFGKARHTFPAASSFETTSFFPVLIRTFQTGAFLNGTGNYNVQ